jgi:nicotinamidase-related amidase
MRSEALKIEDTVLLIIDVQERLAPAMDPAIYGRMKKNLERLLEARAVLPFEVIASEQYPKGLGPTVAPIKERLGAPAIEKLDFSAAKAPALMAALEATGRGTVLVTGMETHICVFQTVRDLLPERKVLVLADAVASRTPENVAIGLELMKQAGATITSTETVLFDLLGRAGTEAFKTVSRLLKS